MRSIPPRGTEPRRHTGAHHRVMSPVTRRVFQSTVLVVEENTTFGMSRQQRANSGLTRSLSVTP
jgi:hypothetical protein